MLGSGQSCRIIAIASTAPLSLSPALSSSSSRKGNTHLVHNEHARCLFDRLVHLVPRWGSTGVQDGAG